MLAVQDLYQEFMATYDQKNWSAVVNTGEHILSTKPTVECAPRERALILAYLATAYRNLGELGKAQSVVEEARREATRGSRTEAYALVEGVTVHAIRGAFSEALAWGAEFIGRSAEWPDMEGTTWLGRVHHNVAYVRRMMKDLPTALVHYKASGAAFRIIGDTPMACYLSVAQAQVQCDLGNLDAAKGLVDGVTESMMPPQRITDLLLVRATYEYLKGNLYPALELAIAALGQSLTRPVGEFQDPLPRALVGHILTKLGHPAEGDIFVAAARDKCARHGRIDLLDQIDRLGGERPWSSELPSSG